VVAEVLSQNGSTLEKLKKGTLSYEKEVLGGGKGKLLATQTQKPNSETLVEEVVLTYSIDQLTSGGAMF